MSDPDYTPFLKLTLDILQLQTMHFSIRPLLLVGFAARTALAQVQGTAPGFAAGTTGGGSASPQTPSSLEE